MNDEDINPILQRVRSCGTMAKAIPQGAGSIDEVEVTIKRVQELMLEEAARNAGAKLDLEAPIASVEELPKYDAIILGTPTRFGNMCSQMRSFLDQTGKLWMDGALIGKVGSVFASTATQHGGQETRTTSFHTNGMIVVGTPYSCQELLNMKEISGGSPYGATTLAGADGSRKPSKNELKIAHFQGEYVAKVAKKIAAS